MLKLEATLIAWTAARPWRNGWSPERGVDFIVWNPDRRRTPDVATRPARIAAAEPVSFIEADEILPTGVTVVRRYVSLAAQAVKPATAEPAERPLTRAWSSMARKLPGS
jgi:hypothetical protein